MSVEHVTGPIGQRGTYSPPSHDNVVNNVVQFISGLAQKAIDARKLRVQRRVDRDAFKTLLSLDDRSLADIGVTREDVLWANKLPLSQNASHELQLIKRSRKR
ncbi:MAG: DUF1127 domain-containing protein [Rhizobiaceae bacterium]